MDARFDAQIEDIREDWDSGNQARAVAGVLGFVPGVGRLAAIASKAGKVAGIASKMPVVRKVADAADAYLRLQDRPARVGRSRCQQAAESSATC